MPLRPNMPLTEYLEIFLRRKWTVILSIVLVMGAAGAYCYLAPRQYKSSTTILVIPQRVPENYVQSTVSSRIQDRLATIKQHVMSRTRLTTVMDELGLFKEDRRRKAPEEVVEEMRKRIEVSVAGGRDRSTEAFSISFVHENPQMAMLTASRMASFFIDENLKAREQQAVGTSEFLESQLKETKTRLEEQEERVKRYKMSFSGELPQQAQSNISMLTRLQEQAKSNADSLRAAQDRKVFLEAQIGLLERASAQPVVVQTDSEKVLFVDSSPSDSNQPLRLELEARRARLAGLLERYTDRYPEVVRARQEVERLEKGVVEAEKSAQASSLKPERKAIEKSRPALTAQDAGPYTRSREEMRRLQAQVAAAEAEIASLAKGRDDVQRQMAAIQAKVDRLPRREQELISLTRDYDNLKKKYDDLLAKKLEADISQNLEKRQKGEQFQIIDPANLPIKPMNPDIPKTLGLGFFFAVALGIGGAVGMEALNPVLRKSKEFKHFFKLPVLAAIPLFNKDATGQRRFFSWPRRKGDAKAADCSFLVTGKSESLRLESFMPLRARLESLIRGSGEPAMAGKGGGCKIVAVTSAIASEGKTVTCANLAMNLAAAGWKRVLLLDADLYKSDVAKGFKLGSSPGLADYLSGAAPLSDIVRNSFFPGLYVVPAGKRVDSSARLLGGESFRSFLKGAKARFDIILLDTPPGLSVSDTLSLRNEIDGFLMIYRMGYTPYTLLRQAVEEVGEQHILGVVLNGVEQTQSRYYKKYYGNYLNPGDSAGNGAA
jgi:succinoglycan biosynthesis transport protein ExoP